MGRERVHHVNNITHSILTWLIFNCGGFLPKTVFKIRKFIKIQKFDLTEGEIFFFSENICAGFEKNSEQNVRPGLCGRDCESKRPIDLGRVLKAPFVVHTNHKIIQRCRVHASYTTGTFDITYGNFWKFHLDRIWETSLQKTSRDHKFCYNYIFLFSESHLLHQCLNLSLRQCTWLVFHYIISASVKIYSDHTVSHLYSRSRSIYSGFNTLTVIWG